MTKSHQKYDLIGDIHGYCDELESLLLKLGYSKNIGTYSHPERKVIFLGDYIDRGPKIVETVKLVRGMVESGNALAIIGNHEYNRICYDTPDPEHKGEFLRIHDEKNNHQTQATTEQYAKFPEQFQSDIQWFKTLPFALDLGGLRCVHACWSPENLDALKFKTLMDDAFLLQTSRKKTPEYEAIEIVLKGKEIKLPNGIKIEDKEGHKRGSIRIKWWLDFEGKSYRDLVMPYSEQVPADLPVNVNNVEPYAETLPSVFFGHYWLTDKNPAPIAPNIACLDYSVAKDGFLCAYRWDGDKTLQPDKFCWVPSQG